MRDRGPGAAVLLMGLMVCALAAGARAEPPPAAVPAPLTLLPLAGPIASPEAEISAMCWCGDLLVLVPQHPERFADGEQALGVFVLDRSEVEAAIDHPGTEPLRPRRIALEAPGLLDLPGWDGIEAMVSQNDTVFLAVEARVDGRMAGYLLRGRGTACGAPWQLSVEADAAVPIAVPTDIENMSQESLVVFGDRVAVFFEANGERVNLDPRVALFDFDLQHRGTVPLEPVEYRITDATAAAADGTFWVINYYFPGERHALDPPEDPLEPVEHLLELRFDGDRVVRTGRPPLDLRADPDSPAHNWEALVRLPGRGFLLMTDRYPSTVMAFVPDPALADPGGSP